MGQRPTTMAHREPALSFHYDESSSLYTQLGKHMETQKRINDAATSSTSNTATTLTDTGVSSGLNNTTSGGGSDSATSTHNNNEASTKPSNGSENRHRSTLQLPAVEMSLDSLMNTKSIQSQFRL